MHASPRQRPASVDCAPCPAGPPPAMPRPALLGASNQYLWSIATLLETPGSQHERGLTHIGPRRICPLARAPFAFPCPPFVASRCYILPSLWNHAHRGQALRPAPLPRSLLARVPPARKAAQTNLQMAYTRLSACLLLALVASQAGECRCRTRRSRRRSCAAQRRPLPRRPSPPPFRRPTPRSRPNPRPAQPHGAQAHHGIPGPDP